MPMVITAMDQPTGRNQQDEVAEATTEEIFISTTSIPPPTTVATTTPNSSAPSTITSITSSNTVATTTTPDTSALSTTTTSSTSLTTVANTTATTPTSSTTPPTASATTTTPETQTSSTTTPTTSQTTVATTITTTPNTITPSTTTSSPTTVTTTPTTRKGTVSSTRTTTSRTRTTASGTTTATIQSTANISTTIPSTEHTSITSSTTMVPTADNNAGAVAGGVLGSIVAIVVCIIVVLFCKKRSNFQLLPCMKQKSKDVLYENSGGVKSEETCSMWDDYYGLYAQVCKNRKGNDNINYVNCSFGVEENHASPQIGVKTVDKEVGVNCTVINELRDLFSQMNDQKISKSNEDTELSSIACEASSNDYDHVQAQSAKFPVIESKNYDHAVIRCPEAYEEVEIDTTLTIARVKLKSTEASYDTLDRSATLEMDADKSDTYNRLQRPKQVVQIHNEEEVQRIYDYATCNF